jgi:GNAT superfamily N-acetyltransferase
MSSTRDSTPGGLVFREIEPGHYEALSSFLGRNDVPAVVRTFSPFPMTDETARRIALEPRRDRYYGAFDGGRVVALSMLRGWDEGYEVPSFGIVVDHEWHGRGVGTRMTEFTVGEARRLGCRRVRLTVYASNAAAVRIYAAQGFVERGREPVLLAGAPDERIVMLKELS